MPFIHRGCRRSPDSVQQVPRQRSFLEPRRGRMNALPTVEDVMRDGRLTQFARYESAAPHDDARHPDTSMNQPVSRCSSSPSSRRSAASFHEKAPAGFGGSQVRGVVCGPRLGQVRTGSSGRKARRPLSAPTCPTGRRDGPCGYRAARTCHASRCSRPRSCHPCPAWRP